MNLVATEINDILNDPDSLAHYGVKRRSGRYPWGSGKESYQHSGDFLSRIEELHKTGLSEKEIADTIGLTTTELRNQKSLANSERRQLQVETAKRLRDKEGLGATEIGRKMGLNESTIRSFFNEKSESRMKLAESTANLLKKEVDKKKMIDVGKGVEVELGVSKEKLNQALKILEKDGYAVYKGGIPNATNKGTQINQKVLCVPGTEHKEIYDYSKVKSISEYASTDGGETFHKLQYPASLDSKRLAIRYKEDGGIEKDGVIELRRNVADLNLGGARYAQVRILVDGTHYLKGMAVYSDDLPKGVDVRFNTNKSKDVAKMDVLKKIKDDPENPFGSLIKANGQSYYTDKDGKEKLSLINKKSDEGDWSEWADKLPSQFLSKQSVSMAKKQLGLALADKQDEYDEISKLTNPTVKKAMLKTFSEDCDAAAVHLKAAALPGQKYHVIIPNNTLGDNEIYAPGYEQGTKLALIRYPHGGTFEIPICTVNNNNKLGAELIGKQSRDAVCINHRVAERLSGADFDGDTVMCIPTHDPKGKVKITSTDPLKGLEGFDNKKYIYDKHVPASQSEDGLDHYYRNGKEFAIMRNTGNEMGRITNLINDMTLSGANEDELARAVRHSMVVIDAEKHKLDHRQSYIDNNIAELKKMYQSGGASTLISRAKGQAQVEKRQGTPKVNIKGTEWYDPSRPEGALIYKTADDLHYTRTKVNKKTGEVTEVIETRHQTSTKMAEADDARTLISKFNTPMENAYADYANNLKELARKARIDMMTEGKIAYSPEQKAIYKEQVDSLNEKLKMSLSNAPKERRAQAFANSEVKAKMQDNPDMTKKEIQKANQQALTKYRAILGAKRNAIIIDDKEWEAIQKGAISESKLKDIINHTDKDRLRELATPRSTTTVSEAKINKMKAMSNSNHTLSDIAKACGVSVSVVSKYLKGA